MGIVILILTGVLMAYLAHRKGFNPWAWILTGGIIGLIFIFRLPSAREEGLDEYAIEERKRKGNNTGSIISAIALIFGILLAFMQSV